MVNACAARGIRVLFVLNDYGSPIYGNDPSSAAWQQGFTNFAAAAAGRYKANNVLWEMFNEPDAGLFPGGSTDPNLYMNVVKQAVPAMRAADPTATILGPALGYGGVDTAYLTTCAQQGLFNLVDALSVHPYGAGNPESYIPSVYTTDRAIISTYHPSGTIPIVSSECGWSTTQVSAQTQGDYAARLNLVNLSQGIPLSVWYDWKNDGTDPTDEQSNFGMVTADLVAKPTYNEMHLLEKSLQNETFTTKLNDGHSTDWLLVFTALNGQQTLVAWTTRSGGRTVTVSGWGTLHLTSTPYYVNPTLLYGDINLDGTVDVQDLAILAANYRKSVTGGWLQGDFNNDGVVDVQDLALLAANYRRTQASDVVPDYAGFDAAALQVLSAAGITMVPEPGAVVMLASGLVGLLASCTYVGRHRLQMSIAACTTRS